MNSILIASLLYYYARTRELFLHPSSTDATHHAVHARFKPVRYEEASDWCKVLGGDLPRSSAILAGFNQSLMQSKVWTGINTINNSANTMTREDLIENYKWPDGSLVSPWADDYPSCMDECCAVAYLEGKFSDYSCTEPKDFVCIGKETFNQPIYSIIDERMLSIMAENQIQHSIVQARMEVEKYRQELMDLRSDMISNRAMGISVILVLIIVSTFIMIEIITRRYFEFSTYAKLKNLFGCK